MDAQQMSTIFDLIMSFLAVLSPGAVIYAAVTKKGKDELVKLLDKTPYENESLANLALNLGLKQARKEMNKLI